MMTPLKIVALTVAGLLVLVILALIAHNFGGGPAIATAATVGTMLAGVHAKGASKDAAELVRHVEQVHAERSVELEIRERELALREKALPQPGFDQPPTDDQIEAFIRRNKS